MIQFQADGDFFFGVDLATGSGSDQDLSTKFENGGSLEFTAHGRTILIKMAGLDVQEPYHFAPSNAADVRNAASFYSGQADGSVAGTLVIRDFVPGAPSWIDDTGDTITGTVGTAIADVTVPAVDAGGPDPTYAFAGSLPAGVAFDPTTRVLSFDTNALMAGDGTITIRATNSLGTADWTVSLILRLPQELAISAEAGSPTAAFNLAAPTLELAISARAGSPTAAFFMMALGPTTTIEAYATVVDLVEPTLLALISSGLTFTFDANDNPQPDHQDVVLRAVTGELIDPKGLAWSSANERGNAVPLRLLRRLLVAGVDRFQTVSYGSITMGSPHDLTLPLGLAAGEEITSVAYIGNTRFMVMSLLGAVAKMTRVRIPIEGAAASEGAVTTLAAVAGDRFAIAGTATAGDAILLRKNGAAIEFHRYTVALDTLAKMTVATGEDVDALNDPGGMARHDSTTMIVADNTANTVPALYAVEFAGTAIATVALLGVVTAMQGLVAEAVTVDTPGTALISSSGGRIWRIFYGLGVGLIGGAVAVSKPANLVPAVRGMASLPALGAGGGQFWIDVADFGASQRVNVEIADASGNQDRTSIVRLTAGSQALSVLATNEAIILPATDTGGVTSYAGATGEILVYRGATRLTGGVTFDLVGVTSVLTASVSAAGAYAVTIVADAVDTVNLTIRVTVGEFVIDKVITVAKSKQGSRGSGIFSKAITGEVWVDAEANTATLGENRIGDRVTLFNNASNFAQTRTWTGFAWERLVQVIDGSLVVLGSIGGNALKIGTGLQVDADGNLFVTNLSADVITTGVLNAERVNSDVLNIVPLWSESIRTEDAGTVYEIDLDRVIPGTGLNSLRSIFGFAHNNAGRGGSDIFGIHIGDIAISSSATEPPSTAGVISVQGPTSVARVTIWRHATSTKILRIKSLGADDDLTLTDIFGIKGTPAMRPLALQSIADLSGVVGVFFSVFLPVASGGTGTYTYLLSDAVMGLSFDGSNQRLSGTPAATEFGQFPFTYTVNDGENVVRRNFNILIAKTATPLALSSVSTRRGTVGSAFGVTLPAATGGTGTYTYSLTESIPGVAFTASTRRLSGTPSSSGSYSVSYTVNDGVNTVTRRFTVSISRVASGTSVTANAGSNKTVRSGNSVTIGGTDRISNGVGSTTRSWSRQSGVGGSLSSSSSSSPSFTAPAVSSSRTIVYRKTVTNNGVTDSDDVIITVLPPRPIIPPSTPTTVTADAGSNETVASGSFSLSGSAVVVNGRGSTTYAWSGPGTIGSGASPSVTGAGVGTNTYTLTATNNGVSDSDTVVVTVSEPPRPRTTVVATGDDNRGADWNTRWYRLRGRAVVTNGVGPTTYSWSGRSGDIEDPTAQNTRVENLDDGRSYEFIFIATNNGVSDSDIVTVEINEEPDDNSRGARSSPTELATSARAGNPTAAFDPDGGQDEPE